MNKIKIFIAVMFVVMIVKSHACDENSRMRTISSERIKQLIADQSHSLLKDQNDLSDKIQKLQSGSMSPFLNSVKSSERDGDLRYQATNCLYKDLANQRKILDSKELIDQESMVEITTLICSQLSEYSGHDNKVSFIVNSSNFKALQQVCWNHR